MQNSTFKLAIDQRTNKNNILRNLRVCWGGWKAGIGGGGDKALGFPKHPGCSSVGLWLYQSQFPPSDTGVEVNRRLIVPALPEHIMNYRQRQINKINYCIVSCTTENLSWF